MVRVWLQICDRKVLGKLRGIITSPFQHPTWTPNDDKLCTGYFVKLTDAVDLMYLTQISGITGKTLSPCFSKNPSTMSMTHGNIATLNFFLLQIHLFTNSIPRACNPLSRTDICEKKESRNVRFWKMISLQIFCMKFS